jgi:transcriptional regulator with XRE-family HTH domain
MAKKQIKTEFQIAFGEHLAKLRIKQDLSYRQLAQRCDVDFSNISKIEKGEINIQLRTVKELAKGLSVHQRELFNFDFNLNKE